jgi:hypothetical protein
MSVGFWKFKQLFYVPMSHPEISVVMPVYNAVAYLEEAVRSFCRVNVADCLRSRY